MDRTSAYEVDRRVRRLCDIVCAIALCVILFVPIKIARAQDRQEVDIELVLAVDVSYSMDVDEQWEQRLGYAQAITSPQVLSAIRSGLIGKIAVSYMEWAGAYSQRTIVDWRIIDDEKSAKAFADKLLAANMVRIFRTSISEGLGEAARMIHTNGYEGLRKVIDVSGDGPNNQGRFRHRRARRRCRFGDHDQRTADPDQTTGLQLVRYSQSRRILSALRDRRCRRVHPAGARTCRFPGCHPSENWCWKSPAARLWSLDLFPAQLVPNEPLCTIGERMWHQWSNDMDF